MGDRTSIELLSQPLSTASAARIFVACSFKHFKLLATFRHVIVRTCDPETSADNQTQLRAHAYSERSSLAIESF